MKYLGFTLLALTLVACQATAKKDVVQAPVNVENMNDEVGDKENNGNNRPVAIVDSSNNNDNDNDDKNDDNENLEKPEPVIDPGYQAFLDSYTLFQGQFQTLDLPLGDFQYSGQLSIRDKEGNIELGTFNLNVNFAETNTFLERKGVFGTFTSTTQTTRIVGSVSTNLYNRSGSRGFEGSGILYKNNNLQGNVGINGIFYGKTPVGVSGSIGEEYSYSRPHCSSNNSCVGYSGKFFGNRTGSGS